MADTSEHFYNTENYIYFVYLWHRKPLSALLFYGRGFNMSEC